MSHTKGELKIVGCSIVLQKADGKKVSIMSILTEPVNIETNTINDEVDYMSNAKHLVKCWNEYDALEAKADCHDDLVAACEKTRNQLNVLQGDWAGVQEVYAPEWTHGLKELVISLEAALANVEKKSQ